MLGLRKFVYTFQNQIIFLKQNIKFKYYVMTFTFSIPMLLNILSPMSRKILKRVLVNPFF